MLSLPAARSGRRIHENPRIWERFSVLSRRMIRHWLDGTIQSAVFRPIACFLAIAGVTRSS